MPGASESLDRWRSTLKDAVRDPHASPRAIHDMRVAARRLRTYCRLVNRKDTAAELSWLIHRTSKLRDLDVVRHPQRRAVAERTQEALSSHRVRRLLSTLARLPDLDAKHAEHRIRRLKKKVKKRSRKLDHVDALHALRRALRELQYARQWSGKKAKKTEALQQRLGDVIDEAVRVRHGGDERRLRRALADAKKHVKKKL